MSIEDGKANWHMPTRHQLPLKQWVYRQGTPPTAYCGLCRSWFRIDVTWVNAYYHREANVARRTARNPEALEQALGDIEAYRRWLIARVGNYQLEGIDA